MANDTARALVVMSTGFHAREYVFRHCVVASTWAFEAQGPGSIPGGGATKLLSPTRWRSNEVAQPDKVAEQLG